MGHETREDSHDRLMLDFHQIPWKVIHTSSDLASHGNGILGIGDPVLFTHSNCKCLTHSTNWKCASIIFKHVPFSEVDIGRSFEITEILSHNFTFGINT